jgi:SPOR domain
MVRILLVLLILINLIYFTWNSYYPPQVVGRQPAALAEDIKPLRLLSEQRLEPRTDAKQSNDKSDTQTNESPVIQTEREKVTPKDDVESVNMREGMTDKVTGIEAYAAATARDVDHIKPIDEGEVIKVPGDVITKGSDTEPVTAIEETQNIEASKEAFTERKSQEVSIKSNLDSEVSADQKQTTEVSKSPVAIRRCYTLGPFEEIVAAESLLIRIQNAGFEASRRTITEQQPARYWVYLPSVESQSGASKIARELASKGIKDYYVVTENKNKNAISLGLFNKHTGARRRYQKIQALGYQPEMEVRFRDKTIYWLDYDEVDDKKLPPQIWVSFMTESGAVQRLVRECDLRP